MQPHSSRPGELVTAGADKRLKVRDSHHRPQNSSSPRPRVRYQGQAMCQATFRSTAESEAIETHTIGTFQLNAGVSLGGRAADRNSRTLRITLGTANQEVSRLLGGDPTILLPSLCDAYIHA